LVIKNRCFERKYISVILKRIRTENLPAWLAASKPAKAGKPAVRGGKTQRKFKKMSYN